MPPFLRRLYLFRCFRENKWLFIVIVLFLGLVAYDHRTGNEITPAFVFSMFSQKGAPSGGKMFLIRLDGRDTLNLYSTFDEPHRMMIFSTLSAYHDGVQNGYRDPHQDAVDRLAVKHPFMKGLSRGACCFRSDYTGYLPWLLRYIREAAGRRVTRIDIDQLSFHYDKDDLPVTDSSRHLYTCEQPDAK